jgi:cobaltochelatase CobN
MMAMMAAAAPETTSSPAASESKKTSGGGHPSWIPKIGKKPENVEKKAEETKPAEMPKPAEQAQEEYTPEQKARARAIVEIERTINNITTYRNALAESPEVEFKSLTNALAGGYIAPSSGGDAVANPAAVPTGRNLYAINAESTPSEIAWEKGVSLVNATLEQYRKQHEACPRKVSYTFWSSEFIETEGATIAQVLYMLGVEPVRDSYGRASDLRLIPSKDLGRPRIDVVIQTSGQFRDLAASRLALISRAVEMAASAKDNEYDNYVADSAVETERQLVEQGISPKEARELSTQRVFGGVNGMYGTGIQGMVSSGDRWESEQEIADTYIQNIGAVYGNENNWGNYQAGLLRAVLHNTDVVVQPRQSNTWGALSLDHVFEFMGGMNLAVRTVTGKDPEAYFADYRNRNNVKMQEIKEAIGVEARSTVFNPAYIKEVMKGNASSASQITEVVTNTYGWNVMKPNAIDNEMWDKIYEVYVKDEYGLGTESFFRREDPYALQEITAVMMETARKGMWKATGQQLSDIAALHTGLVREFGPSGSGFAGNNMKLQDFIAGKVDRQSASEYKDRIHRMKTAAAGIENADNGMVLSKKDLSQPQNGNKNNLNGILIVSIVLVTFVVLLIILRKRRK